MKIGPVPAAGSGAPPTGASAAADGTPLAPPKKPIAFLFLWFVIPVTLVLIAEVIGLPQRLSALAERFVQPILPF